jgi:hypothetical protein
LSDEERERILEQDKEAAREQARTQRYFEVNTTKQNKKTRSIFDKPLGILSTVCGAILLVTGLTTSNILGEMLGAAGLGFGIYRLSK